MAARGRLRPARPRAVAPARRPRPRRPEPGFAAERSRPMIPLRDRNPTARTPVVTLALVIACFAVFGLELWISLTGGDDALNRFFLDWGAVPHKITDALATHDYLSQALLGTVTSQFLHAGWLHILGNLLFLWIFGNNVEDRLGRIPF